MAFRQDLTPAQHVARREALAQVARGAELDDAYETMMQQVAFPIARSFGAGSRLDGPGFEGAVARLRECLSGLGPPILRETRRPATRAKPKGEEHEFLTTLRSKSSGVGGQGAYELVGVRAWLSRRRMEVAFEYNGQVLTSHMLQRSIERGLASWTGRLAEIENAVTDGLGLVTAWRHAVVTGRIRDARIAIPCKDGLVLGDLQWSLMPAPTAMIAFNGSTVQRPVRPPNAVNSHPDVNARGCRIHALLRTVVDEGLLSIRQDALRDAIAGFVAENAVPLARISETALWPGARLMPETADATAAMDAIADRLAALLAAPDHAEALDGREGPLPFVLPCDGPLGLSLGEPRFAALHPGDLHEAMRSAVGSHEEPARDAGAAALKRGRGPMGFKR